MSEGTRAGVTRTSTGRRADALTVPKLDALHSLLDCRGLGASMMASQGMRAQITWTGVLSKCSDDVSAGCCDALQGHRGQYDDASGDESLIGSGKEAEERCSNRPEWMLLCTARANGPGQ